MTKPVVCMQIKERRSGFCTVTAWVKLTAKDFTNEFPATGKVSTYRLTGDEEMCRTLILRDMAKELGTKDFDLEVTREVPREAEG